MVARNKNSKLVKERDKVCQKCGSSNSLEVHHIEPYDKDKEENNSPQNLILLCRRCHGYAPNSEEEMNVFLSLPLPPEFTVALKFAQSYHIHILEELIEAFDLKTNLDFSCKEGIVISSMKIPKMAKKKNFFNIVNPYEVYFIMDKFVDSFNQGKDKCRAYRNWKIKIKEMKNGN